MGTAGTLGGAETGRAGVPDLSEASAMQASAMQASAMRASAMQASAKRDVMEMANSDHTDQKKMAQTLSHGLVVTMLGIGLAVPAILFAAFFRNRLIGLSNETSNVADDLLTQMYHNSKKPAPSGSGAVPAVDPVAADNRAPAAAVRQK